MPCSPINVQKLDLSAVLRRYDGSSDTVLKERDKLWVLRGCVLTARDRRGPIDMESLSFKFGGTSDLTG